ncbi:hypothetical protein PN499_13070 [Kamptonema animale CS-326]|jgi:hypothetical protein|uniref:hypothetical protein n=1 Tax=Kamptonema animale TaxID=92934 RepID=UPI00232C985D|nr:hypothetical protein [Kamptonema animale]MDB9512117.1 hypothetical protein [Kamptonema animale CS-326]
MSNLTAFASETMSHSHPCLFCKDKNLKRTNEHVIQRAFGSNWTLPRDVCSECNTVRFSPLDGALLNFIRTIVYCDHPDLSIRRTLLQQGHDVQFDEASGLWVNVHLDQNGQVIISPQLIFVDRNRITFRSRSSSSQFMLKQIMKELSSPNNLSLNKLVIPQNNQSLPPVQPAIIRSSENHYLIRASNSEDIDFLNQKLLERDFISWHQEQAELENTQQQGWVHKRFTINPNDINRALAKSAVNAVCAFLGPERARHPLLDPIKSFILGHTSDDANQFVKHLWEPDRSSQENNSFQHFNKPGHHTVILASMQEVPLVIFCFYALPFACVRLSETNFLQESEIFAALINYKSRSHEVFSLLDNPSRFCQRFYSE